ncbi:MAG: YncE family protein [Acidimicrobiales bacterium]
MSVRRGALMLLMLSPLLLVSCVNRTETLRPGQTIPFIGALVLERAPAKVVQASVLPLQVETIHAVCANPSSFATSPGGTEVDVTCPSQGTVIAINVQAQALIVPPIRVRGTPTAIAYAPLGNYFYVVNTSAGSITPIEVATHRPQPAIKVGPNPTSIAVSPDSAYAYVSVSGADYIAVISLLHNRVVKDINVGPAPGAIAISPSNSLAYVVNSAAGTVVPVDLQRDVALPPIQAGADPVDVAFSPDGQTAFVVNKSAGTVTPINVLTSTPNAPIAVGTSPVSVLTTKPGGTGGGSAVVAVPGASAVTVILKYQPAIPGGPGPTGGKFTTKGRGVVEEQLPDGTVLGIISLPPGSDPVAVAWR